MIEKHIGVRKQSGQWQRSVLHFIASLGLSGVQGSVGPSEHWRISWRMPHATSGISAMSALTRVHLSIPSYAQDRTAHLLWWETYHIWWSWGKQRCNFPQLVASHTLCADDVVTHKRWKICATLIVAIMDRRAVTHHSSCVFTLPLKISDWQTSAISAVINLLGRAAFWGLKVRPSGSLQRGRTTGMVAWKIATRPSGNRRKTGRQRTHRVTKMPLGRQHRRANWAGPRRTQQAGQLPLERHGTEPRRQPRHLLFQEIGGI